MEWYYLLNPHPNNPLAEVDSAAKGVAFSESLKS